MSLWYRYVSVLFIVVIILICVLYFWFMIIIMCLFYRNYYKSVDFVIFRVLIIFLLVIV